MKTPKKALEGPIQNSICEYLELRRRFFFRVNNQPIFDVTRKTFRALPKYTMKGIPDICVLHEGQVVWLEVKRAGAKQSPEQKEFQVRCEKESIEYYVVRSIDDVKTIGL